MATVTLSQTSLPLNNKFALLEEADQLSDLRSFVARPKNHARLDSTDTFKSWSVVDSDEEHEDDEARDDDVYTWTLSTDAHGLDATELPPPLAIANLDDGFTAISKVLTVQSINGATAAAMASQGSWLIKGKKMKRSSVETAALPPGATTQGSRNAHVGDDEYTHDDDSLQDDGLEHQLSKSARATNRQNIRIANARDRKLVEAISDAPRAKMDRKDLREARWHSKAQKSTDAEYATTGTRRK